MKLATPKFHNGFVKANSATIDGNLRHRDLLAYAAGLIEGFFDLRYEINLSDCVWTWNTSDKARLYAWQMRNCRPDWKRYGVSAIREMFKGVATIKGEEPVELRPVAFEWSTPKDEHTAPYRFSAYSTAGEDRNDADDIFDAYDKWYLERKGWKNKSKEHGLHLLASMGVRKE